MTGGIACYKVPYLVRSLTKEQVDVKIIMTEGATKFITTLTMETVSRNRVSVKLFPEDKFVAAHHIEMAQWPDLVVIVPATANFIGKVASGIADDLLTSTVCATPKPVMIAPAMNQEMWNNPITQKNFTYLMKLGYIAVGPEEGEMAEKGHAGMGRMAEPDQVFDAIQSFFKRTSKKKALEGKKILVTAGPTREALDPVRYLSNHSSGKMGYALAEAAFLMGAEVTLISGPTSLKPQPGVEFVSVESTDDLLNAVKTAFKRCHCLIMSAAPADYSPVKVARGKIKKKNESYNLELKPTPDILKELRAIKKKGQLTVGFALETDEGVANARKKLEEKGLDMIVLNQPGENTGFSVDTNQVTIIQPGQKPDSWPIMEKREIALKLLDLIVDSIS